MSVEVKLELGHKAILREKPTVEGFTHDWTVYVKGSEGSQISHYVEKVVFHLHESFHKPKRVVKEEPFQVSESGYAGFMMPIDVHFKNKEEPKKVCFEYDLYLQLEGEPVNAFRLEKLTFNNPSEDFRRKLLKARGVGGTSSGGVTTQQVLTSAPVQHTEGQAPIVHHKSLAIPEKKPRPHIGTTKETPKPVSTPKSSQPNASNVSAKPKQSPDPPTKSKEYVNSSHHKPHKSHQPHTVSSNNKEAAKIPSRETHNSDVKSSKSKTQKIEKDRKSTSKRAVPPDESSSHSIPEKKKKKLDLSNSDSIEKLQEPHKIRDPKTVSDVKERKEKHKSKSSSHSGKRDKNKISASTHVSVEIPNKSPKVAKLSSPESNTYKPDSPPSSDWESDSARGSHVKQENDLGSSSPNPSETVLKSPSPPPPPPKVEEEQVSASSPPSPDSSYSPFSDKSKSQRSENNNDDSSHSFDKKSPKKLPSAKLKSVSQNNKSSHSKQNSQNSDIKENAINSDNNGKIANDSSYQELLELRNRIMALNDQHQIQRIVDVIEKTGRFQMTSSSFDFDLYRLDNSTVRKLKHCLAM